METPVAFLLYGAVAIRPPTPVRTLRAPSAINWTRAIALGLNLMLWTAIVVFIRHLPRRYF